MYNTDNFTQMKSAILKPQSAEHVLSIT